MHGSNKRRRNDMRALAAMRDLRRSERNTLRLRVNSSRDSDTAEGSWISVD